MKEGKENIFKKIVDKEVEEFKTSDSKFVKAGSTKIIGLGAAMLGATVAPGFVSEVSAQKPELSKVKAEMLPEYKSSININKDYVYINIEKLIENPFYNTRFRFRSKSENFYSFYSFYKGKGGRDLMTVIPYGDIVLLGKDKDIIDSYRVSINTSEKSKVKLNNNSEKLINSCSQINQLFLSSQESKRESFINTMNLVVSEQESIDALTTMDFVKLNSFRSRDNHKTLYDIDHKNIRFNTEETELIKQSMETMLNSGDISNYLEALYKMKKSGMELPTSALIDIQNSLGNPTSSWVNALTNPISYERAKGILVELSGDESIKKTILDEIKRREYQFKEEAKSGLYKDIELLKKEVSVNEVNRDAYLVRGKIDYIRYCGLYCDDVIKLMDLGEQAPSDIQSSINKGLQKIEEQIKSSNYISEDYIPIVLLMKKLNLELPKNISLNFEKRLKNCREKGSWLAYGDALSAMKELGLVLPPYAILDIQRGLEEYANEGSKISASYCLSLLATLESAGIQLPEYFLLELGDIFNLKCLRYYEDNDFDPIGMSGSALLYIKHYFPNVINDKKMDSDSTKNKIVRVKPITNTNNGNSEKGEYLMRKYEAPIGKISNTNITDGIKVYSENNSDMSLMKITNKEPYQSNNIDNLTLNAINSKFKTIDAMDSLGHFSDRRNSSEGLSSNNYTIELKDSLQFKKGVGLYLEGKGEFDLILIGDNRQELIIGHVNLNNGSFIYNLPDNFGLKKLNIFAKEHTTLDKIIPCREVIDKGKKIIVPIYNNNESDFEEMDEFPSLLNEKENKMNSVVPTNKKQDENYYATPEELNRTQADRQKAISERKEKNQKNKEKLEKDNKDKLEKYKGR